MRVYKDLFTEEEIVSDSFNIVPIFDGVGGEILSKKVKAGGEEIDIGRGNQFGGGNDEETNDQIETVLDVIDCFRYKETSFTKKDYTTYLKGYMKLVKEKLSETNPDRVDAFMKGANDLAKFIISTFKEFTFYTPESYDIEHSIILSYYKGEDETPTFLYFMDGLVGETY